MSDQNIISIENIPPQNIEAEQAVLGGMLQSREASIFVMGILSPEDFFREYHGYIYSAIKELIDAGEPADIVTVADKLHNKRQLEKIGGMTYLSNLAISVPTVANIEYYARIVHEKACRRALISAAIQIAQLSQNGQNMKLANILDKAEQFIFNISQNIEFHSTLDTFEEYEKMLDERIASGRNIIGLRTGKFKHLDEVLNGFRTGLYVFGGVPNIGKSSLVQEIAYYIAKTEGIPCLIFSYEDSLEIIFDRYLSRLGRIDLNAIEKGKAELDKLNKAREEFRRIAPFLYIFDSSYPIFLSTIRAFAERAMSEHNKDKCLIIVDYIQSEAFPVEGRFKDKREKIGYIIGELRKMSHSFKVPIIAVSSCPRASYEAGGGTNRNLNLSAFKESGSIEYSADVAGILYWDDERAKNSGAIIDKEKFHPVNLMIVKNKLSVFRSNIEFWLDRYHSYNEVEDSFGVQQF